MKGKISLELRYWLDKPILQTEYQMQFNSISFYSIAESVTTSLASVRGFYLLDLSSSPLLNRN
jgi:hypothetical protein